MSGENCTEQLDVPGPWLERLPHFRHEFTPSNGDELQSEYILDRRHAAEAIEHMRSLGGQIAPLLYASEIRTIASDRFWLSPSYDRECVAFHLTWKPRQPDVENLLPAIEEGLLPLGARPPWGKLFAARPSVAAQQYTRFEDFRNLAAKHDPSGKFRNTFLDRLLA